MDLLDYILEAYDIFKDKILESFVAGIFIILVSILLIIPVLGWFFYSKLLLKIIVWYYDKLNIKVDMKYDIAFKSIFIQISIIMTGATIMFISIFYNFLISNIEFMLYLIIFSLILIILGSIIQILLLYTLYGSILGKVNKFKIYWKESLHLFFAGFIVGIVYYLLYFIINTIPYVGSIIAFVFSIFYAAYIHVLYATVTKNIL